MRIVYLSRDMSGYDSASYQRDVMEELARQADVFFYGPGFACFDEADRVEDVLAKAGGPVDWIVCGHSWLTDGAGLRLACGAGVDLGSASVPKAFILNKEYARLDEKLAWARSAGFDFGFTHHHDAEVFGGRCGFPFVFWPFAADHRRFVPGGAKTVDLAFSGILQNTNVEGQSDLRVRIMRELFECEGDLAVRLRERWSGLLVRWNGLPRSPEGRREAIARGLYARLDDAAYAELIRSTRVLINTRSPMGLVSPRVFEAMLSGTVVLSERNGAHGAMGLGGRVEEFDGVGSFAAAAERLLGSGDLGELAASNRAFALAHHTWERRVASMLGVLGGLGSGSVAA